MIIYKDRLLPFIEFFNPENGTLIRTNLLDKEGNETGTVPQYRYLPELIDIGIMGHCSNNITCKHFGIECYQGDARRPNLLFEKYKEIIDQVKGFTFQVALGGKGDPNKHERFLDILKYTKENGIIPNLTTSGYGITEKEINIIIEYCGSVAISFYSKLNSDNTESNPATIEIINSFKNKIPTNIHYVIGNNTIDDAIKRLQYDLFPKAINGIIFLLYKPVGSAINNRNCIIPREKMKKFLDLVFKTRHSYKIGFDTCFSNHLFAYDNELLNNNSIQTCESGRFSCYVSCDYKMFSCSFRQDDSEGIQLTNNNFLESWNSLIKQNHSVCPYFIVWY